MGLKIKLPLGFAFCSFIFQVRHSNLETVSFLNGPTFIQLTMSNSVLSSRYLSSTCFYDVLSRLVSSTKALYSIYSCNRCREYPVLN